MVHRPEKERIFVGNAWGWEAFGHDLEHNVDKECKIQTKECCKGGQCDGLVKEFSQPGCRTSIGR